MAFDFSNITDEELEAMAAQSAPASEPMPQKPLSEWTDEELEAYAVEPTPAPVQSAANPPRMTREERIAANNRAIETARSQEDPGFLSAAGEAIAEGAKGAARAVKSIGSGIVGMASGAVRLSGTPVRAVTGWEGLHRLADTIDSSYENFGRDALMSEYGENPDGWGYATGRFGEKLAGTAGSLAGLGATGKAVGAAGTALKAAGHAKTAAAVANTLPLMFGNDAAVRAYDTARANGKSKGEAASLAGLNGAIHFLGFKAFENKALNKMLGMPAEMEAMMPKWANAAAEAGGQSFSSLARGVRNGMIKYTLAERGKGALKAGGIMGLQDMLSDPVMQVAEGASIDDIDFSRMLKAGASGLGEGALMEGALGAASVLKSPSEARKFIADKIFRGKDYKVRGSDGKMHDEPGLLNTYEGRMVLMKQNPDATERVLDIVEHGGTPRPAELDAAFLPPDMTVEELKKFASDWRNDLKPYVDEAWAADAPRQTAAPDAAAAEPGRDMLSPEEAQSQQKAANDAAERQKVADRRAAADSMMLDFESWNRLYADGKTDLNFDEWRAAGKPGVIEANLTPKTEEASTSETRANEAPAQPEQREVVAPPAGAEARPVESAEARSEAANARVVEQPAVWPNGWDNAGEEIKGYVVPNDGDVAPGREVAIAHRSGGSINAPQKIKGVVESVDGDKVKVYYRDGMGYDQHDTFKKSELVGVMPLTAVPTEGATSQMAENRTGATQEGAGARPAAETATATPAPAKPAEAPKTDASATAPAESGKAAPVVEKRGDAAEVAAPESVEAKIAAMKRGSPEQLKAQREYVEREVAKAKDAIKGKFRPKAGRLSPREKAVDAYERVKNTGDIPETVNIKVPGDGEITVKNNPNGMAFLDRFAAKFRPHPTSGESAMALPRSPSIKVSDKPKAESAEKEFAPFVSKDSERMLKPYTEEKMVVATNGRIAIRRPLRNGEVVKGADDAPRTAQIFGRAEDAATESAAIDAQAIFPKLQQALALEGSLFAEMYEPETGKPTGLIPRATSHAVELWRDAGGALQVRSRDTDGNGYASDAWSGDSVPVAAFDGKALVEIVRLAAKNGEGKIEVRFAKDAQNNPVLFSFGGYEAVLMPLRAKGHFDEARRVDGESARANPAVSAEGAKSASRMSDAVVEIDATTRESAKKVRLSAEAIADIKDWIAKNSNGNFTDNGLQKIFDAEMERVKAANGGVNPKDVLPTLDAISVAYHDMKSAKPVEAASRVSGAEGAGAPPAERVPDGKGKMVKVEPKGNTVETRDSFIEEIERDADKKVALNEEAGVSGENGQKEPLDEATKRELKEHYVFQAFEEGISVSGKLSSKEGVGEVFDMFKNLVEKYNPPRDENDTVISQSVRRAAWMIESSAFATPEQKAFAHKYGEKYGTAADKPVPDGKGKMVKSEKAEKLTKPAKPPKSNRLRRADGTEPLAEKNPAPKTVRKAVDKISLAISNRTGTGVITPKEADGIVRGIVESPETKHNRYRDFFNPLENDAKWHESLGLDAESAKNIRDAVDRVKTDADLKKWFPQVDAAVKKANDGRLSKKDAAPLFGKISEGLEKAERMGLSETANRLREAAEVIRPVAETVEQGDVNKFNYSTKGKKLNNRLGGTDKRGGKTVSLDTKNGTVDVRADGKGSTLGGNRHLIIDGVNGDELTVTMKDAAGKTLATRKMSRAQWSALSQGAVATDGDPANPQKGDLIRMSRSDTTDAPQSWTPEMQKPLERVAHALRNVVTVGGKRLKVEFLNERPESDGPGAFKNADGVTVGEYDAAKGEIRLYPGATVADVVHEFTHPLVDFARAEAKAGRGELLDKINQIIDAERATWEQPVREAYKDKSNETILEEIFTHAMGEKGADLFGKSTKTLQGRRWYNRLWEAIKGVWQDFATKMGWNKADLRGLDGMSPEDAAQKILSEMAKGRNFGDAVTGSEGTRNAIAGRKGVSAEEDAAYMDAVKRGDMETAERMVREAAKSQGYTIKVFHGTDARFTVFDNSIYNGSRQIGAEEGFFFAPTEKQAARFATREKSVYIPDWGRLLKDKPFKNQKDYEDFIRALRMDENRKWPSREEIKAKLGIKSDDEFFTKRDAMFDIEAALRRRRESVEESNKPNVMRVLLHDADWDTIAGELIGVGEERAGYLASRKAMGYTGVKITNADTGGYYGDEYVVFKPNDVKSADPVTYDDAGNVIPLSQRFNTQSEDIRYSRRVVPPPAPTTKDIADWLDGNDDIRRKWRRALQDKNIGIRDIEEKLGITDKNESAYYAKDRAFGKNEHELTVLQKQEVEPIVEKIHKSGGDLGLFSAYLYARHAGERNAVLKAEKGVDNGSGMNDAQAKAVFDAVDRLGLRAAFEDAAKDVWAMNRKYLQRRVDAGRMTQAEADFLTKRYQHYVPLRTDMTNEELDIFNSTTSGWKRNETMSAEGRKSAADDPLAFSIVQNEQAIRASNANEVRRRWAGVVRRSKGELGEIVDGVNKGTAKWAFTFGDGETVETGSPMKLASERDDIILFKENGQLKAIKMKPGEHGRGLKLARAVTDKDVAKFNEYLDWIPRATRWMSAMRTQYVPTFIIRNFKADNLEVMLNALSERGLRGENGRSGGAAFFGKFLKNEFSVAKGVREYFKTGKSSDRYVQEAVENGLLTGGGMAAEGFTETARRLSDTLQALRERPNLLGGTLKAAKDTISLLNACAEYNTRMGVYKTLREEGMSVADAVSYARDVTVNFNRKGYLTPYTNAAFMFSNAAIQGMGRAFKSMGSEHGKGVVAGLFMVGVAQALLDDWLGHDDEKEKTGGADSRNMTEYDKEHSLGVALPTGHRVKTGIRNPWALPMYAGRKTVELLKGITSGEQAMKDLANAVGGFVTEPVGGNGFGSKAEFLQTIMPTIIDPFVQWGTGKDYKGEDRLKKSFDKTAPQSWNGKERTPEAYKLIAQGLNALTGGNEFRKGWVDSAPEDWQLLAETVFGGVLTDLNNVVKAGGHAVDVARGKPAAQIARDIPFVRDTFTNLPENSNRYYAALEEYKRDKAEFKKTTPERRKEMKADKPYLFVGKSLLDGQIELVKEYMHRERGEVKVGQKWVEPKTPRTEAQKEEWRKKRLALQAQILERLGK